MWEDIFDTKGNFISEGGAGYFAIGFIDGKLKRRRIKGVELQTLLEYERNGHR